MWGVWIGDGDVEKKKRMELVEGELGWGMKGGWGCVLGRGWGIGGGECAKRGGVVEGSLREGVCWVKVDGV